MKEAIENVRIIKRGFSWKECFYCGMESWKNDIHGADYVLDDR